jgi:hypothetical protein
MSAAGSQAPSHCAAAQPLAHHAKSRAVRPAAVVLLVLGLAAAGSVRPLHAQPAVPSPEQVLGHALGERFTDHAGVLRYMQSLADALPPMARRPRDAPWCSSSSHVPTTWPAWRRSCGGTATSRTRPRRRARRARSPRRTRQSCTSATACTGTRARRARPPCGRRSTSSAARPTSRRARLLVVVMDPVANPDGRDRYVNWYRQARGATRTRVRRRASTGSRGPAAGSTTTCST